MREESIHYSKLSGYTRLFGDFINHSDKIKEFFGDLSLENRLDAIHSRSYPRHPLYEILCRQNKSWGASDSVFSQINKLKDNKSVIVTAGQQACLLGGPYLILLKAISIIKKAEALENELSVPVIPLFWIASDDHDYKEISFAHCFNQQGEIVKLSIDVDESRKYPPVGNTAYDESIRRELDKLKISLPENDFHDEAIESLERFYKPGQSIIDSFAGYLHHLLGQYGLVLFNPYDEHFKQLAAPMMIDAIKQQKSVNKLIAETNERLGMSGYHLQVEKPHSSAHLFTHLPQRVPIHSENENFIAGKIEFKNEEMISAIENTPLDYSPDALLRPVLQSFVFPVLGIIGGPSEIAYFAQIMPLYDLFNLPRPRIYARASATLIEKRFETLMDKWKLTFSEMSHDFEKAVSDRFKDDFPEEMASQLVQLKQSSESNFGNMKKMLGLMTGNSVEMVEGIEKKINYQISELSKKMESLHKRQHKSERNKLQTMRSHLYPMNKPAERVIAPVYFISRYGQKVIDFIFRKLEIDVRKHQLINLSEFDG